MTETDDLRSLDICAIGLGQGGGNLAAEWRRRGYRSLFLNTARADLRALAHHEGLGVPDPLVLDIGLDGSEGAGKDPAYGMACIRERAGDIRAAVEEHLGGADAFLLCAGLGGGTGSALPELVRALAPLEIPFLALTSLPSSAESGIAKVNAVKTVNGLVGAELAGRMFIDNDRLVETFPELDVVSYFPAVNARVLASLDELNRLNRRADLWSIRTFDGEDLRKVLLSGGVLQAHVAKLSSESALDASYLVDVVNACVDGGDHLARGLDISKTAYLALVVVGPEKALRATAMHVFDDAVRELKQRTGGGAVYEGLYVAPDDAPLKAYVLSASFSLPDRVGQLLADARAEGEELAKKIQTEIAPLELGPLDDLSLFRSPSRRAPAPRLPPPEARPLDEQIANQVRELTRPRVTLQGVDLMKPQAGEVAETRAPVDEVPAPLEAAAPAAPATPSAPTAPPERVAAPEPPAPAEPAPPAESYRPHVGTGRYDDEQPLEPTQVAAGDALLGRPTLAYDAPSAALAASAAATGRVELADDPSLLPPPPFAEHTEALPVAAGMGASPVAAPAPPVSKSGKRPTPIRPRTNRAALLPDGAKVAYEAAVVEAAEPPVASAGAPFTEGSGVYEDSPQTDPHARIPFLHRPVSDEGSSEANKTRTDARPDWMNDAAVALSSVSGGSGNELQAVYEDLVERFGQAADKRDKERVGRRLVDDAQADDVEVRALAVWAMVKIADPAFKRTLRRCTSDGNPEIARMAKEGVAQLP